VSTSGRGAALPAMVPKFATGPPGGQASADLLLREGRLVEDLDAQAVGVETVERTAAVAVVAGSRRHGHALLAQPLRQPVDLFPAVHDEAEVVQGAGAAGLRAVQGQVVGARREVHVV